LKRAEFELFISTLVNILSKMPIQRALQNDGLNPVAIDQNVLVGGSRRIPAVQALVEKILDKKSTQSVNLDEAVALRAAVQT
jgi:molecular chaperone DnaK